MMVLSSCASAQPAAAPAAAASKPPGSLSSAPGASTSPSPSAAASAAAKPAAADSQKLNIAYVAPSTLFLWEWVGLKQGLFEKNGIQVNEPVLVTGTPRLAQAVLANNFEVA